MDSLVHTIRDNSSWEEQEQEQEQEKEKEKERKRTGRTQRSSRAFSKINLSRSSGIPALSQQASKRHNFPEGQGEVPFFYFFFSSSLNKRSIN